MIISYITLLPIDKAPADAVHNGNTIKPIPVRLNVIELNFVAIITNASYDFNFVVNVLFFSLFSLYLLFLSLKYIMFPLMLLIWLLKLFTSFDFLSNRCSKSIIFSDGAEGYNLPVFASI